MALVVHLGQSESIKEDLQMIATTMRKPLVQAEAWERVIALGSGIVRYGLVLVVEICVAALIALRPWSATACLVGSAGAVLMFLTTLSFLFSAPGWEPSLGGFPALSAGTGQFLIKDVVLLGVAVWSLGESMAPLADSKQ